MTSKGGSNKTDKSHKSRFICCKAHCLPSLGLNKLGRMGHVQYWYGISIREGNILHEMSNYQLLKNQCALVS